VNDETLTAQRPAMSANPIPEAVRAQATAWFAEYDKHNHFPEMLALDAYAAGHAAAQQLAEIEALRAEVDEWKRVAAAQAELHGEAEARAERLAEALRIAKETMLSQVKWEACDCGCPQGRKPADAVSVTWLRAVQQVGIATDRAEEWK
jgi:hypothetical protein